MARRGPIYQPPTETGDNSDRGLYTGVGGTEGDQAQGSGQGETNLYRPGNFTMNKLQIKHKDGILELDGGSVASILITESIFQNTLTCRVIVLDATEQLAELDLDGHEEFIINFNSEKNRKIGNSFNIYRTEIQSDQGSGNKGKVYQLFGISSEYIDQASMDINKAFTGKIHNTVRNIYNTIGSKKRLDLHTTDGVTTHIIPGETPFEAISRLCRRAYSSTFSSSIYLFYEDMRGFNFVNVEKLIADGRRRAIPYSYRPDTQVDDKKTVEAQYEIQQIDFPKGKNLIDKIESGAYASAVAEIDIINQKLDVTTLTVKENFKDFYHLDKPAITLDKKSIIDRSLNVINSTKWINKYIDGQRHKDNNFGALITRRKFYGDSLGQIKMNCVVPGNSDLEVGTVLKLDMLEQSANKETPDQEKKISGKYLITEVNHQIQNDTYMCTLSCSKESYRANVPDINRYERGNR